MKESFFQLYFLEIISLNFYFNRFVSLFELVFFSFKNNSSLDCLFGKKVLGFGKIGHVFLIF